MECFLIDGTFCQLFNFISFRAAFSLLAFSYSAVRIFGCVKFGDETLFLEGLNRSSLSLIEFLDDHSEPFEKFCFVRLDFSDAPFWDSSQLSFSRALMTIFSWVLSGIGSGFFAFTFGFGHFRCRFCNALILIACKSDALLI